MIQHGTVIPRQNHRVPLRPAETFRAVRGESLKDAAVFYLLLLVFTSVLAGVMVYLGFVVVTGSGLGITLGQAPASCVCLGCGLLLHLGALYPGGLGDRLADRGEGARRDAGPSTTRSRRPSTPRCRSCCSAGSRSSAGSPPSWAVWLTIVGVRSSTGWRPGRPRPWPWSRSCCTFWCGGSSDLRRYHGDGPRRHHGPLITLLNFFSARRRQRIATTP